MSNQEKRLRVLELFSGIGGMHFSLMKAKFFLDNISQTGGTFNYEIIAALDINEGANFVYRHNFPMVSHLNANICGLKSEVLEKMQIDAIFMSPPCQPFTRQGLQKDLLDTRAEPLSHLIKNIIPKLSSLKYILLENVKGFETSNSRNLLVNCLSECGFKIQEFLMNPTTFGIPNSRLRYYLIAKKSPETFAFPLRDEFLTTFDFLDPDLQSAFQEVFNLGGPKKLSDYFDGTVDDHKFLLPERTLQKYGQVLDVVRPDSENSCCFTKAYSKYAEGTGSVIQGFGDQKFLSETYNFTNELKGLGPNVSSQDIIKKLQQLQLRYFTPNEIARLLGFPVDNTSHRKFSFPDITLSAQYKLLGNSLSVTIVSMLTVLLFLENK